MTDFTQCLKSFKEYLMASYGDYGESLRQVPRNRYPVNNDQINRGGSERKPKAGASTPLIGKRPVAPMVPAGQEAMAARSLGITTKLPYENHASIPILPTQMPTSSTSVAPPSDYRTAGGQFVNTPLGNAAAANIPWSEFPAEARTAAFRQTSPEFQAAYHAIHNNANYRAMNTPTNSNIQTYGSMGRPVGYMQNDSVNSINDMVAANKRQQMLNGLTPSQSRQLQVPIQQELPVSAQQPPQLRPGSPFLPVDGTGARHMPVTRTLSIPNGNGGATLIGANAKQQLEAAGITPGMVNTTSLGQQTLRKIQSDSESRQAQERIDSGLTARKQEYAQAAKDARILRNANQYGLGKNIPAVAMAAERQKYRLNDERERAAGLAGNSASPKSYGVRLENADAFSKTPLGQQVSQISSDPRTLSTHIQGAWKTMSDSERKGFQDWVETNPALAYSADPYINELKKLFAPSQPKAVTSPRSSTAPQAKQANVSSPWWKLPYMPLVKSTDIYQ